MVKAVEGAIQKKEVLKQISMGTGIVKNDFLSFLFNTVNEHPIRLNMAFPFSLIPSMQGMVFALRRQGLFVDENVHDIAELTEIPAHFSHQLEFFSETFCKPASQHGLIVQVVVRVVPHKVFPHLISRVVQFGRDFAPHHGPAFLNGGDGLGVKKLFPGYGVAVRGADGAFVANKLAANRVGGMVRFLVYGRNKNKHSPPRWYFARHVNGQSVADRYIYGLCNTHVSSIA